jgi:hypothetical protein
MGSMLLPNPYVFPLLQEFQHWLLALLNPYVFPLLQEFQHGLTAIAQPLCLSFAVGISA